MTLAKQFDLEQVFSILILHKHPSCVLFPVAVCILVFLLVPKVDLGYRTKAALFCVFYCALISSPAVISILLPKGQNDSGASLVRKMIAPSRSP